MSAKPPAVFVVDDDRSVRRSLTRLLASAGYAVEAFASAREFLERKPHEGPCCLVLDVRMPGLTGLDLQAALAGAGHRMSIVFVTGHGDVSMSVRAMKGGAVDGRDLLVQHSGHDDGEHLSLPRSQQLDTRLDLREDGQGAPGSGHGEDAGGIGGRAGPTGGPAGRDRAEILAGSQARS